MGKIFKQLARHWAACLVVIGLLFVQAYCDLSLPDYTSKIVDTGIQQGGIESPLPQTLRSSTRDALSLLMSEEDAETFRNAYGYYIQDDGVLKLRADLTAEERASLEEIVTMPDIVLYMAASQAANGTGMPAQGMVPLSEYPAASSEAAESAASSENTEDTAAETIAPTATDLDAVCAQFAAMAQMPGFSREMIQQQLASAMAQIDETTLSSMASQATLLVSLEYEAQGVAHDVQMQYLFRVGGQMLGLTLLMVAVAILVGLIASRVSAAIGRDLRRQTFSSVIHFSNAEIENFSTASLITRTTNDIQQVQFVCVILLRMVSYAPILGIGGVLHVVQGNTGLAWIIVLDVVLLLCLIVFLMNIAMPKFKIMQTLVDKLNLVSREILTGVMPVRAFSRETFEEERFDKASKELMGTQLFTNRAMVAMMPFMTLIMNGTSLLIVWFGGKAMDAGNMQVGRSDCGSHCGAVPDLHAVCPDFHCHSVLCDGSGSGHRRLPDVHHHSGHQVLRRKLSGSHSGIPVHRGNAAVLQHLGGHFHRDHLLCSTASGLRQGQAGETADVCSGGAVRAEVYFPLIVLG